MRKLTFFAVLLVLVLGASFVAAQDDLSSVDPSGQSITYWHQYGSGAQLDTMTALVEDFNANNEWGITVEAISQGGYNDIRNLMSAAITSGDLPNLVAGYQNDAESWYLDGAALDLNPYFNDETWGFGEEASDLNQGILDFNIINLEPFNGAMLAWPNQVSANMLSVNLDMLAEAGFDGPPETFEDFKAIACATTELTGPNGEDIQGYPIKADSSNFESMVASRGGSIFDFEANQYDFTNDAVIETLQMYQDLYTEGCAYIPDSAFGNTDDFAFGLNPMALGSSAGIPFTINNIEESGSGVDNWITTTTPWTDDNRVLQLYVPSIVAVPSTPEENLASWLFLKYLSATESQITWTENTSYFPISTSAAEGLSEDFISGNPYWASINDLISSGEVAIYSAPQVISYGEVRGLVAEAMADVTTNGMDVNEVAERLEADANEVHAESM